MTKAGWSYTGPVLPTAESNQLLADGVKRARRHPHGGVRVRSPDRRQEINAFGYVQAPRGQGTRILHARCRCGGRVPAGVPADYPVTYWVNPAVVSANEAAKRTWT